MITAFESKSGFFILFTQDFIGFSKFPNKLPDLIGINAKPGSSG
jgi:hypothetical protein